jgi:tripartite-type tricarboxylate transporter receptor subunit TctC
MSMKALIGRRSSLLLCAAGFATASSAAAQTYPDKPVRVIVPFAPGGGSDSLARLVGNKLSPRWGQPIIVDNRGGAGGTLGAGVAAKAAPDGYTLMVSDSSAITMNPWLYSKLPYAAADFVPVIHLATFTIVLLVPPNSPYNSLADLIAAEKAKPGSLNAGTAGNGTSPHLVLEMLNAAAGTSIVHVPYRGGGPANTAFMSGELDLLVNGLGTGTAPLIADGSAKAIAVTTPERIPYLPNVPTIAEAGFPGFEAVSAQTLFAPAGTPPEIFRKLNQDVFEVLQEPDIAELWRKSSYLPAVRQTPAEISAWLAAESAKWARVVQTSNIRLD